MPTTHPAPKKLCILRLSAIGDVCNALSVVQSIQNVLPKSKITWIIGKTEYQLFQHIPNIHFVVFDKKTGVKGIFKLWKTLKNERFDVLLNMQTAFRASILSLGIRAKRKIGYAHPRSREGQRFFVNEQVIEPSNPHVLAGFMAFAEKIGVDIKEPTWDLHVPQKINDKMAGFLTEGKKTIVIAPCSSKAEKDWLPERYAEIVNLLKKKNHHVILTGGKSPRETALLEEILKHCQEKPLNLAGKTSLIELAALIGLADLVISPDSGAGHIASAMNTPVIGLYAYHNPKRTGFYRSLDNIISVYDDCLKEESYTEPLPWAYKLKGENLMARIPVERVARLLNRLGFL